MVSPTEVIGNVPYIHRFEKDIVVDLLKEEIQHLENEQQDKCNADNTDYLAILRIALVQYHTVLERFEAMPIVEEAKR